MCSDVHSYSTMREGTVGGADSAYPDPMRTSLCTLQPRPQGSTVSTPNTAAAKEEAEAHQTHQSQQQAPVELSTKSQNDSVMKLNGV